MCLDYFKLALQPGNVLLFDTFDFKPLFRLMPSFDSSLSRSPLDVAHTLRYLVQYQNVYINL